MSELEITTGYSRIKGAIWFPYVYQKPVLILGAGGIGSWLALQLGRLGCELHIYDMDDYDETNLTGQFVSSSKIGLNKALALSELIYEFNESVHINTYNTEYKEDSLSHHIVFSCFDNMKARKIAFKKWVDCIKELDKDSDEFKEAVFIDGRLHTESFQVITVTPDVKKILTYSEHLLFDDDEVEDMLCTFKQTSFLASMIASIMTIMFINNMFNKFVKNFRSDIFYQEYNVFNNTIIKKTEYEFR